MDLFFDWVWGKRRYESETFMDRTMYRLVGGARGLLNAPL